MHSPAGPPGGRQHPLELSLAWCLYAQFTRELQRPWSPPLSAKGCSAIAWGLRLLPMFTQRSGYILFRHTGLPHGPCCMSPEGLHSISSSVLYRKWTITVLSLCSLSQIIPVHQTQAEGDTAAGTETSSKVLNSLKDQVLQSNILFIFSWFSS